jgi:hypothetical protein
VRTTGCGCDRSCGAKGAASCGFGIAAATAGARLGMQALQVFHLGLESGRQAS